MVLARLYRREKLLTTEAELSYWQSVHIKTSALRTLRNTECGSNQLAVNIVSNYPKQSYAVGGIVGCVGRVCHVGSSTAKAFSPLFISFSFAFLYTVLYLFALFLFRTLCSFYSGRR